MFSKYVDIVKHRRKYQNIFLCEMNILIKNVLIISIVILNLYVRLFLTELLG